MCEALDSSVEDFSCCLLLMGRNVGRKLMKMWRMHVVILKRIGNLFNIRKMIRTKFWKGLEEDLAATRRKSQESFQWVMKSVYWIREQMLEQARGFCTGISVTTGQLDPFKVIPGDDTNVWRCFYPFLFYSYFVPARFFLAFEPWLVKIFIRIITFACLCFWFHVVLILIIILNWLRAEEHQGFVLIPVIYRICLLQRAINDIFLKCK